MTSVRAWAHARRPGAAGVLPALVYLFWGGLFVSAGPGYQYDEALLQFRAVELVSDATLPQEPAAYVRLGNRRFPLMISPYIGAAKTYLTWPAIVLLGPTAGAARLVSLFFGALGVWGFTVLLAHGCGAWVGILSGLALAMHPSYLDQSALDNTGFSVFMGCLGLSGWAATVHLRRRSVLSALLLGLTFGFGVWCRSNFVWMVAAAGVGALAGFGVRALPPVRHLLAISAGVLAGCAPMLAYELRSGWGTLQFMKAVRMDVTLPMVKYRLHCLADILLSDAEHRAIWGGGSTPAWQSYAVAGAAALGAISLIAARSDGGAMRPWGLAALSGGLLLTAILLFWRMDVQERHMVAILPFVVAVGTLGLAIAAGRPGAGRAAAILIAVAYAAGVTYWNVVAIRGLHRTGGVRDWSDAIVSVQRHLEEHAAGRQIQVLDWGLSKSLFFLSGGKLSTQELFWGGTSDRAGGGSEWSALVGRGGLFLLNSPGNQHFPRPGKRFLSALDASGLAYRELEFRQRSGRGYARLFEVFAASPR